MTDRLVGLLCAVPGGLRPEENAFIAFDDSGGEEATVRRCVASFGAVKTNGAVAADTTATGDGLRRCRVNRQTTVTVTPRDRNGDPVRIGLSSLCATITKTTSTAADGRTTDDLEDDPSEEVFFVPDVTDNRNGTYDVTYLIREHGHFRLSIRLYGQPIAGSPFRVRAHRQSSAEGGGSVERPRSTGSAGGGRAISGAEAEAASPSGGGGTRTSSTSSSATAAKQRGTKRPSR